MENGAPWCPGWTRRARRSSPITAARPSPASPPPVLCPPPSASHPHLPPADIVDAAPRPPPWTPPAHQRVTPPSMLHLPSIRPKPAAVVSAGASGASRRRHQQVSPAPVPLDPEDSDGIGWG
ncbi:hypothetical protein SETIT_9G020400v2 [Setaria italica]|uniref:Uncharacterized protein n=1 Tax=Setaria italica TaxID=4555 RepID=A0A368SCJ2_SETIT|nr:hypothetical protein SETIT_9G020400v2 [Setaria italica]